MKKFASMLALCLLLSSGAAFAADPAKPATQPAAAPQTMDHSMMNMKPGQKMDMSSDKPVAKRAMAANEFAQLDKNKDGKVARAEVPAKNPLSAHFDMLDTNQDGSLSKVEFVGKDSM